jgi:integrase
MMPAKMDLATTLDDYIDYYYVPDRLDLKPDTVHQLHTSVSVWSRYLSRPATLADLTDQSLKTFLAAYLRDVASPTVNGKRRQILAIWRHASEFHGLPWPGKIAKAREPELEPEAWTAEQVGRILDEAKRQPGFVDNLPAGPWWYSLLIAAYYSGIRSGALLSVPTAAVNWNPSGFTVPADQAKDRKSRWCAMPVDAIKAIAAIYSERRTLLWPWPLTPESFRLHLNAILDASGVPYGRGNGGSMHKFRRTSGTLVEAAGGDGARHLGNSRKVFEKHYLCKRLVPSTSQVSLLPQPR